MDIFLRNMPKGATNRETRKFLKEPLAECGIQYFYVNKLHDKPNAVLTVPTVQAGHDFLAVYGMGPNKERAKKILLWQEKPVYFAKAQTDPSERLLNCLAYEQAMTNVGISDRAASNPQPDLGESKYQIKAMYCGAWDYVDVDESSRLVFVSHFKQISLGNIYFGSSQIIIILTLSASRQVRVDLNYRDCETIVLGSRQDPSITFTLRFPPKIYGIDGGDQLVHAFKAMELNTRSEFTKKDRLPWIDDTHTHVVGSCFAYRITLIDGNMLESILPLLNRHKKVCTVVACHTSRWLPSEDLAVSFKRLSYELNDTNRFGKMPFSLRYQIERLAKNGKLQPSRVIALLPAIFQLNSRCGLEATCYALRQFYRKVAQPGPVTDAEDCTVSAMKCLLDTSIATYNSEAPDNIYDLTKRHEHISLIHRVVVTPSRIRLEGPEPEPTNRVLRRYKDHTSNFMRVVFQDEDCGQVGYDPRTNQNVIYRERFKHVLDRAIIVAGISYSFLGFSHSSLRSQACWFMATLSVGRDLINAEQVLKMLGDFSNFRCPAKCAARIGQNFTDTNATVDIAPKNVSELAIVERNGRDFSDGVGTISADLLSRVWHVYGSRRTTRPTALQIRFQGSKGMVSFDSRLRGERLMLRSNMKKFETETTWNLEICGANFCPLPMVLNRQFIKVLEDLGIGTSVFMDLQNAAMNKLRLMTQSAFNAASFIEQVRVPKATHIAELLLRLHELGLDYHEDDFMSSVIEMSILSKLRDLKYRGRIPVEKGVTLYGIMDETAILKENEIYVVIEKTPEGRKTSVKSILVQNDVVVTRSPALHPGDIQVVNAVNVPVSSPLRRLSNVVVFSQHGQRDLPSQLSGGDLDGDLYNIIFDPRLVPRTTYVAADYPRVPALELDRVVTQKDMSDFFVNFMESDQLGMLSNLHVQLADQRDLGTLDPDCLKLAEMASTAVDFSKTGISVNLKEIPKHDRCRPDFMASSPRVVVSDSGYFELEEEKDDDDEAFDGLDTERRPHKYYKSYKALGRLYRAIDERQFLENMQRRQHHTTASRRMERSLLDKLFKYLEKCAQVNNINWSHQIEFARGVMANYNSSIIELAEYYEPSTNKPLTETEIFAGTILGRKGGYQGKPLRMLCDTMRTRFSNIAEYTTMCIRKGSQQVSAADDLDDLYKDYDEREVEALPRALACVHVAMAQGPMHPGESKLKSFRYIAVAIALEELGRYQTTVLGTISLPLLDRSGRELSEWHS